MPLERNKKQCSDTGGAMPPKEKQAVQRYLWVSHPPERNKKQCRDNVGGMSPHRQTRSSAETLWVGCPPREKQEAVQRYCGCDIPPERNKKQCRDTGCNPSPEKQEAVQRYCGCDIPPERNKISAETLWVERPPREKQEAVQRHCGCDVPHHHLIWGTVGRTRPAVENPPSLKPSSMHWPACRVNPPTKKTLISVMCLN